MGVDRAAIAMLCTRDFWRMAVCWPLALLFSHLRLLLSPARRYPRRRVSTAPGSGVERPICVITGAASGLGAAAACALAAEGYHVVLAGRSPELLDKTMQEIKQKQGDACLSVFLVDLSSIHSIKKFGNSIKQWLEDSGVHPSIQLLINNAGILATSSRGSADGYDQMLATNYIGPFVLTNLLLPLLKNSPMPSRIVNVTSFTHRCVSDPLVNKNNLIGKDLYCLSVSKSYPFSYMYELSKLYILLFSYELHQQLYLMDPSSNVTVTCADPGTVKTNIMREIPSCLSQFAFTVLRITRLLHSPETGVGCIIDAALAPPEASGEYFFGGRGRTIRSSKLSYNARLGKRLFSSSSKCFQGDEKLVA